MPEEFRLAELVAALSLGIDLGFGQPMEHVLRQCIIALRLADRMGLGDDDRSFVYYTALLVNVGCHSDAHEQAKWFGDDIEMKSRKYDHGPRSIMGAAAALRLVGSGNPPLHRFRVGLEFLVSAPRDLSGMIANHAAMASALAREIGLPVSVQHAVGASYEQWDGKGWPGKHKGAGIPLAARLSALAEYVEVAHRLGGVEAAMTLASKRSGSQFDPAVCDLLCSHAPEVLDGLQTMPTWETVISSEPALRVTLSGDRLDAALTGVADFIDLKSPYTLGHARAVASISREAGRHLGLDETNQLVLYRTGLVHGFGRLGVSNAIWDKPGPLGAGEWERVRFNPYLTERMLSQSGWLAPLGAIAVQLRERLDGSGYPRGLAGGAISPLARILAAADVYQSMSEPRPHREPLDPSAAAAELRADVRAGRLDADAAEAVLAVTGHRPTRRRDRPAGLTAREVDVLQLLALGRSSRQIADALVIAPKTARNHIEHIYAKTGASNRASASLFAVQHGLLPEHGYPAT